MVNLNAILVQQKNLLHQVFQDKLDALFVGSWQLVETLFEQFGASFQVPVALIERFEQLRIELIGEQGFGEFTKV